MKKRLLSVLLACTMGLSLLPVTALALPGGSSAKFGWQMAVIQESGRGYQAKQDDDQDALHGEVTVELTGQDPIRYYTGRADISAAKEYGITITPADGYYVKAVIICCNDGEGHNCQTAKNGNVYSMINSDMETGAVVISARTLQNEDTGFHRGAGYPNWIMIELGTCPSPVYVQYDFNLNGSEGLSVDIPEDDRLDDTTAKYEYIQGEDAIPTHRVLPLLHNGDVLETGDTVEANGSYYTFQGWQAQYYIDASDRGGSVTLSTPQGGPSDAPALIALRMHVKLTAQWEKAPEPQLTDGTPINVEVYVDDVQQNANEYIAVDGLSGTTDFEIISDSGAQIITFGYTYQAYDCADIQITPKAAADSYVLQAIAATLIGGNSGSSGIDNEGGAYSLDNVDGGCTVRVYFYTPYTVTYYVDGEESDGIQDDSLYVAGGQDRSGTVPKTPGSTPVVGTWVDAAYGRTVNLESVPSGCSGWYTTDGGNTEHSSSYTGTDIKTAAESSGVGTPTVIECYAVEDAPGLTVAKTIVSIGGTNVEDQQNIPDASVGDTIIYQIEVENTGNTVLENIRIEDTLGNDSLALYSDTACETAADSTITSLAKGEFATFYAKYIATADDAGETLINSATAASGTTTNTGTAPGVPVKDQYTLTVNYYYDSIDTSNKFTPENISTTTYTLNEGENWSIAVGGSATATHNAPQTVTKDSENYTFDSSVSSQTLKGTISGENITVDLVYAKDVIGGGDDKDQPDQIPDKYQVTVNYVSENTDQGTVAPTKEILVIKDNRGKWATSGTVTAVGSTATANEGYFFNKWTKQVNGETATDTDLPATASQITLENAISGQIITFKAYFTAKTYELDVEKTLTKVGTTSITSETTSTPLAQVGDDIVWTITVKNTGNQTQNGITVTDTMSGAVGSAVLTIGADETDVTINSAGTATITGLAPGASVTLTATYTVQQADAGKILNNTAAVSVNGAEKDKDTPQDPVTVENPGLSIKKTVNQALASVDDVLTYTITVKNTGNMTLNNITVTDSMWGSEVKFITVDGTPHTLKDSSYTISSLAPNALVTIAYSYTVMEADIAVGSITNHVTAESTGGTTGSDSVTVSAVGSILIQPADITIYTGGESYGGVANDSGSIVSGNGLPEPGFYFTLPDDLDSVLKQALGISGTVDLSPYLTLTYGAQNESGYREWTLERYDPTGSSMAFGKYIYRLLPNTAGQDPVRLQFTDQETGEISVSDQFTIENALFKTYDMGIYPGGVQTGAVKAVLTVNGKEYGSYNISLDTGTLTIRGVNDVDESGNASTTEIADALTQLEGIETVTALVPDETTYFINGSEIQVSNPSSVKLLVDSWSNGTQVNVGFDVDEAMGSLAQDVLDDLGGPERLDSQFKYLDLVDTGNGNAWVTASNPVTVCWPYPQGTNSRDAFTVIHYQGLDREFNLDDLSRFTLGEDYTLEVYTTGTFGESNNQAGIHWNTLETTDYGLCFTVNEFSPFALVWETQPAEEPEDDPDLTVTKELTEVNGKRYTGGSVEVGDVLTYEVTVKNTGNVALSYVTVTDVMKNAAGSISVDEDALSQDVEYNAKTGQFTLYLTRHETDTVTYTYQVQEDDAGKTLRNTVTVESSRYHVSDSDSESVVVEESSFTLPDTVFRPTLNYQDHVAYIIGYVDGTVRPLNEITRSEVAAIFFRLMTDESRAYYWSQTNSYTDVDAGDWFNNAVSTLSNAGILTGYEDGTYRPDQPITRAEFAAIAARFSDAAVTGGSSFTDVPTTYWAAQYIALAQSEGWITGYEDGTYRPDQNITRAEVMTLINRVLERAVNENGLRYDMVTWSDNVPGTWYYEAVQEATNSHQYIRTFLPVPGQDFNYEYWENILPVPDWAALEKAWSTAYSK